MVFISFIVLIVDKYKISRDDITVGRILGEGFFGEVHDGVYQSQVRFFIWSGEITDDQKEDVPVPCESDAFTVMWKWCIHCVSCVQTEERISVAIKTCKNCSGDVKEKFLSEARECAVIAKGFFLCFTFVFLSQPHADSDKKKKKKSSFAQAFTEQEENETDISTFTFLWNQHRQI